MSSGVISYLKKLRDGYVINQVQRAKLPQFEPSPVVRKRLVFLGRVQKVGFRLEMYELARRLNLTGWVRNREDKSVEAEIQGEESKIFFLIAFLRSLKRASVRYVEIEELPVKDHETDYRMMK